MLTNLPVLFFLSLSMEYTLNLGKTNGEEEITDSLKMTLFD